VPWGLKRFQETRDSHFITFSCYRRRPNLGTVEARCTFQLALERVREQHKMRVCGCVVMPEHVHLLISEPECGTLAQAIQSLKQGVARRQALREKDSFWEGRYYDFNVWSEPKFVEKLKYIHRNPVRRGLVERAEDWAWSSFAHYLTGDRGPIEIESHWTARIRERAGIFPTVRVRSTLSGAPLFVMGSTIQCRIHGVHIALDDPLMLRIE
jgi:putative transposase